MGVNGEAVQLHAVHKKSNFLSSLFSALLVCWVGGIFDHAEAVYLVENVYPALNSHIDVVWRSQKHAIIYYF